MDNQNVIELTNDLEYLEKDFSDWQKLTFEQRKLSDSICIEKYGCNNIELYNSIKSNIIKNQPPKEEPIYMNEDFHILKQNERSDIDQEILINNIQDSLFIQRQDDNIVIINDFISDDDPDYDMEYLINRYKKYTLSNNNYKIYSNEYSLQIWGKTVPEMFNYMKSKIQRIIDGKNKDNIDFFISPIDNSLIRYQKDINKTKEERNFIEYTLKAIDCFDKQETLYESVILEIFIKNNNYEQSSLYTKDLPYIVPYFTYDEYIEHMEIIGVDCADITPFNYIFINDSKKYYSMIEELSKKYKETSNNEIEKCLLKLGWNPAVPVNGETVKFARDKQLQWLNKNSKCNIINLSEYNLYIPEAAEISLEDFNKLEPIFIVLSHSGTLFGKIINKFKKSIYSHAGISLTSDLSKIYSFGIRSNGKENGVIIETLDDYKDKNGNADLLVIAFFVDPLTKEKIIKNINWYMDNQDKTKYSIKNLARIVVNKKIESKHSLEMVCSQFVDNILKMSNIDITNKSSNLVAPSDLDKPIDGVNMFVLFEGKKSNFKVKEIDKKIQALKANVDFNKLNVKEPRIIINKIRENVFESLMIESENKNIESLLKDLRNYISIKPSIISISEAKTPIGFNNKGGLYLQLPKDLQSEYNESHKLLSMYNETNLPGIKHELARLFYLNSIIEKKLKKINKSKNPEEYKELIDLRARILNDYTTYFKLVKTVEKDFDFMEYMKTSDYYNKNIVVDDSTLKYSGSYIKKIIGSIFKK